ncbi:MAG TPA: hypothetical protein VG457_14465 [Planctomycetota bacterium]|nr:hypothetical protein [Planctomycetota bacterium]
MALTAVGLAVTAGSAASAGYSAKRGHDEQVQAQHQASDAQQAQLAAQNNLAAQQKANSDNEAQMAAFQQQRAQAMSSNYRDGTIRTSPSGVFGPALRVGGNSILGAA